MAGALVIGDYQDKLAAAGFRAIEVEVTRTYDLAAPEAQSLLPGLNPAELDDLNGTVASALIRAKK